VKRYIRVALLLLLAAAIAGPVFLLYTGSGLRLGLHLAARFIPGELEIGAARGRVAGGFVLEDFRYRSEGADIVISRVSLSWRPASLLHKTLAIGSIDAGRVEVILRNSGPPHDEETVSTGPPGFPLPLALEIGKASIDSAAITSPGLEVPMQFMDLGLQEMTADSRRIRMGQFFLAGPAFSLVLAGEITAGRPIAGKLQVDYAFSPEGYDEIEGSGIVAGSPEKLELQTDIMHPFAGRLRGTVSDPAGDIRWHADLAADEAFLPDIHGGWPAVALSGFRAEGSGSLAAYSLRVESDVQYADFAQTSVRTNIDGDSSGLRFTETLLAGKNGELAGRGGLNWRDAFTWEADLHGRDISLAGIKDGWPGVFLREMAIRGGGEKDRYALHLAVDARHDLLRENILVVTELDGDGSGMSLTDATLSSGESMLNGNVRLDWRQKFSWHADMEARGLNPALADPRWPGSLDLQFQVDGSLEEEGMAGRIHLRTLTGTLRGYPVTARGEAAMDGRNIFLPDFHFRTLGTELTASGFFGEKIQLDFQAESEDLAVVWPELAGSMQTEGKIAGTGREPQVSMRVTGSDLEAYGQRIEWLDGNIDADATTGGRIAATLSASGLILGGHDVDAVEVGIDGTAGSHTLELYAEAPEESLELAVAGKLVDAAWIGEIQQLEITTGSYGSWNLGQPGQAEYSGGIAAVRNFCLAGPQDTVVCGGGTRDRSGEWLLDTEISALPVALLQKIAPQIPVPPFAGTIAAKLKLAGTGGTIQSGGLSLAARDVSVLFPGAEEEKTELAWRENVLHAELDRGHLTGKLTSILRNGGSVEVTVALDHFSPFTPDWTKMNLRGAVRIDIPDLKPLAALSFPLVEPGGSLTGGIELGGTAASPAFTGEISLADGRMFIPRLGITVANLEMDLQGARELVTLRLTGDSGEGTFAAEGELRLQTGRPQALRLAINGDNFEAVRLPELVLQVDPRLQASFSRSGGEVRGTLRIREGLIAPTTLAGAVTPSRDVVFVKPGSRQVEEEWPFTADMKVIVDDRVEIYAFGLQARIKGEVRVVDVPGRIATGTGGLEVVEGTFSIYGRKLQIRTGQLLFSGGPLYNPGVAVRAENSAGGVTTGIGVSGFLRQPEIAFYSDPPMEENQILSRLLMNASLLGSSEGDSGFIGSMASEMGMVPVGSALSTVKDKLHVDDIKVETGKTSEDLSLVIGTWLTPSLYISYGKNLLKESGSFNTRYILGHGFSVETETGATESGVDLKYEIEM
jgi:translocation and assembly module TamB